MPLTFQGDHPGGMVENSPAFQRRDKSERASSPEGTAERGRRISRPFGTYPSLTSIPALKRRAIVVGPSGTETGSAVSREFAIGLPSLAPSPFRWLHLRSPCMFRDPGAIEWLRKPLRQSC